MGVRRIPKEKIASGMGYKSFFVELRNKIAYQSLYAFFGEKYGPRLHRLGSNYGGWFIPDDLFEVRNINKVLISAGIGFDVSFDLEMLLRGFKVILIDPDEKCCNFAREALQDFPEIQVIEAALSETDGLDTLYSFESEIGDRWSSIRPDGKCTEKQFKSLNLSSLVLATSDSVTEQIMIVKLDIEGAESRQYAPIAELADKLDFVCIEIDYIVSVSFLNVFEFVKRFIHTLSSFKLMARSGLTLCHREESNFFWVNYGRNLNYRKASSQS